MKKGLRHTITSWVAIVSFLAYSTIIPTLAYADEPPPPASAVSVNLDSCSILGVPTLQLTLPQLGSTGQIYSVGGSSRYRLYDNTTSQALDIEGTFLDKPAAASLLVGLQNIESVWQVELNRVLSYNNACWQYRLSLAQAEVASRDAQITIINEQMTTRLQIRDDQIEFLTRNLRPTPWYESGEFWFAMGIVGGVLITVGAGYAIGQAN